MAELRQDYRNEVEHNLFIGKHQKCFSLIISRFYSFRKSLSLTLVMRDSTRSKLRLLEIAAKILIDKNVADIHH